MPYLSASAVVIHYEEALYQVYGTLPFYLYLYQLSWANSSPPWKWPLKWGEYIESLSTLTLLVEWQEGFQPAKILHHQSTKILLLKIFVGSDLTWTNSSRGIVLHSFSVLTDRKSQSMDLLKKLLNKLNLFCGQQTTIVRISSLVSNVTNYYSVTDNIFQLIVDFWHILLVNDDESVYW